MTAPFRGRESIRRDPVFRTRSVSVEDLVFRLEALGERLVAAIDDRPAGEPALAAFRRLLRRPAGLLARIEAEDPRAPERQASRLPAPAALRRFPTRPSVPRCPIDWWRLASVVSGSSSTLILSS